MLPLVLHVHAICVNLRCKIVDEAQDFCNESAWLRFAETALEFPQLQVVELHQGRDPEGSSLSPVRVPAFVGITDAAFRPLIEAKKFMCLSEGKVRGTTNTYKDTVNPRVKDTSAAVARAISKSHAELAVAADHPGEYTVLNPTLMDIDAGAVDAELIASAAELHR